MSEPRVGIVAVHGRGMRDRQECIGALGALSYPLIDWWSLRTGAKIRRWIDGAIDRRDGFDQR